MAKAKAKKDVVQTTPIDTIEDKVKAVESTVEMLTKKYGDGAIMKLDGTVCNVESMPTGCLSLDVALGIGGLPRGRIVELYGPESAGKTTICLTMIAEEQKNGGICAFIDAEHAIDPIYATALGVDTEKLYFSQPDNGEQALDIAEALVNSNGVSLIIIDSVAALTPKSEIEGSMGDSSMGVHARMMSQAMRKLSGIANKMKCTIVFTNQIREKIGFVLGNPETTPGGRALKFYASVRMDIRRVATLTDAAKEGIGVTTKIKVVKNKVASPFRLAIFDIMFGKGVDKLGILVDVAANHDIIHKAGAWFSYNEVKIGQGKENVKTFLKENPEIYADVENKVRILLEEKKRGDKASIADKDLAEEEEETANDDGSDGFDVE